MRKTARRRKSGNLLGGLLLLLILAGLGFAFWKLGPQLLAGTGRRFDRINIALAGRQVAIISYSPANKSAIIVRLPDELYLPELVHGYGQYKAASVYSVGELDKRGGQTLKGTLREYLGVPVDNYYYTDKSLTDIKTFFIGEAKTDLTLLDRVRLAYELFNVRFDRVKTVDLGKVAGNLILADGTSALSLEKAEVDSFLAGLLTEQRLVDENLRVEVVNTTPVAGLGNRGQRLLSNIGLTVVNVESASPPVGACQVQADKDARSFLTVARIARIYGCKIEPKPEEGRAAVTLMLGQDYADYLIR